MFKDTTFFDCIVLGGGAAGFFAAINLAEQVPSARILILEKDAVPLKKVRISGGGRCNVTNACFEPRELAKHYPRGSRELLGPFHKFCTGDMMAWLDERGVPTKIENDGRVFPVSDSAQSIVDCFTKRAQKSGIQFVTKVNINNIIKNGNIWQVSSVDNIWQARCLLVATGSSRQAWSMLENLGHKIVRPVPSLFTFNVKDARLDGLMGLSVPAAKLTIPILNAQATGPLLITHWGLSGPAVLRLSAWEAIRICDMGYEFDLIINWINSTDRQQILSTLLSNKESAPKRTVASDAQHHLPKRLWARLVEAAGIGQENWAEVSKSKLAALAEQLVQMQVKVKGKSVFKEEFVTAGGVDLTEVDFKSFQSKLHEGLYFAGEVLNIDAITGGFNFQAAWTGAWVAALDMARKFV